MVSLLGRKGRLFLGLFAIGITAWGTYQMLAGYFMGYPFWWYNSSFILYGFTMLGLLLLVLEGLQAFRNYEDYGLHPESYINPDQSSMNSDTPEYYESESQRLQQPSEEFDDSMSN